MGKLSVASCQWGSCQLAVVGGKLSVGKLSVVGSQLSVGTGFGGSGEVVSCQLSVVSGDELWWEFWRKWSAVSGEVVSCR